MISVKTWPIIVFDVFESCEVLVLVIRAMYALTMVLMYAKIIPGICGREELGESDEFRLARINFIL